MKKGAMTLVVLVLFWPFIGRAEEEGYYSGSFARLSFVKGDVSVERAHELGTEEGVVNLALVEGDKLITRAGRAEVHFGKKNYLRLAENTEVEFSVMPREGDNRVRLHLWAGKVYLRISFLREEKTFEIHTPDASFYVLEEGLYRLDMGTSGQTVLAVFEGSMEAAGEEGSKLVSGRQVLAASAGHLGAETVLSSGRDDFDSWNDHRDSLLQPYASRRYLPAELDDYEEELNSHGYWVYERPYGYVWVPYVVYSDWRPYYYGRWVWYPLCGWTWVSYEPWGWCVYHYGRWHWRLGLGWYWIPTRYWGPAWVHWYWGFDYVGWCPLGWYNRPIVIVNNYFYDRYHHAYYPAHSRALTVVHRHQLQAPDVSRVALNRVEASRLGKITLQARQPDIKPTISRQSLNQSSGISSRSQPQIRPASKSLTPTGEPSSRRSPARFSAEKVRPASPSARSSSGLSATEKRTLRNEGEVSRSTGSISVQPRRIAPLAEPKGRTSLSSTPGRVKSFSASPSISSPGRSSTSRIRPSTMNVPRTYKSDPGLSRPRTSSGKSILGRDSRSVSRSFPSFSSPRSIFSAPRSSSRPAVSLPRSSSSALSSFSRAPSRSIAPSRSAPSRSMTSSPSRSSSGRVVKRNN